MSSLESFDDHYVNEEFDICLCDYKAVDWFNTLLQIGSCNSMVSQNDWILEIKSMKTKKIITAIIAAVTSILLAGILVLAAGLYYKVVKAGTPFQDPTPELQLQYLINMGIGMFSQK